VDAIEVEVDVDSELGNVERNEEAAASFGWEMFDM
jgi:hypothetical protein